MASHDPYEPADDSPAATHPTDTLDPRDHGAPDAHGGGAERASDPIDVATLQQERDELYDRLLRQSAEFDNYRKRVDRDRRAQADEGIADILLDLLLVADDFDRALETNAPGTAAAPGVDDPYRKGVELIHTKLREVLRKRGVRPVDALGTDFDPNVHQAVVHEASPEHREGEVIGELRRGYMLGDRLLRPAMVKVAKT